MLVLFAWDASAQVCSGGAPFNYAPWQVAAGLSGGSGGASVSASAGYGKDLLFGMMSAASGNESVTFDVTVGSDQPVTPDNRFRACPLVAVGVHRSDDESRLRLAAGGRASVFLVNTSRIWVVPNIGLHLRTDGSLRFVEMEAGVGFVRTPFALRPSVLQRAGDIRATRLQISASFGF